MKNSIAFLYINSEYTGKKQKNNPIQNSLQNSLNINPVKVVNNLYNQIYRTPNVEGSNRWNKI